MSVFAAQSPAYINPMGGDHTAKEWPMYTPLTQNEIDRIIARAKAKRAGAFGRMMASLFGR